MAGLAVFSGFNSPMSSGLLGEALLRMKERARELGCNAVCNVRFDSADIGGNAAGAKKKGSNMAVALVSGTAWRRPGA